MQTSEHINELATALAKAQGQIRAALKDSINPHFRSRYADLSAVWDACRAELSSNGLSVIQTPTAAEPGHAALTTMLLHSSGQYIHDTAITRLTKDDAQGLGSAITYLRRYSLAAMVGVVADEDDDGNTATNRPAQPQRAEPPAIGTQARPTGDKPLTPNTEAGKRYFDRFEQVVGGRTWKHAATFLNSNAAAPTTVEGWQRVTEATQRKIDEREALFDEIDAVAVK